MATEKETRPNISSVDSWLRHSELVVLSDSITNTDITSWTTFEAPVILESDDDFEHILRVGETLYYLSFRYYGADNFWWIIALRNKIDLPDEQAYPGKSLIIPSPAYVEAEFVK